MNPGATAGTHSRKHSHMNKIAGVVVALGLLAVILAFIVVMVWLVIFTFNL